MPRLDLRLRIAAALAVTCIAVVGALGIALYTAADDMEEAFVEQIVAEELDFLVQRYKTEPGYQPTAGPNLQYYIVRTPAEAAALPDAIRGLAPGRHSIGRGIDERHIQIRQIGDARIIVVYDAGAHELREAQFRNLLLLALATVVVVALAVGYWLAGVLTRQLTELARRVTVLQPDGSRTPLAHEGQEPEVAALAHALDEFQARIAQMIEAEQDFSSNVSHELRTPLTAIQTSCELLCEEPGLGEKARKRVMAIAAAAERMTEQIQALLFLARKQNSTGSELVALGECVNDAVEPFRPEIRRKGLSFEIAIPPDTVLDVNREALHLTLSNLIRNAIQHTESGTIRVDYNARRLTVTDSGVGIAADHLPHVFERYYRGDRDNGGHGLGLAIVKSICDRHHWRIEVKSAQGCGAAFRLTFS